MVFIEVLRNGQNWAKIFVSLFVYAVLHVELRPKILPNERPN